jgi:group I intron endonuclease
MGVIYKVTDITNKKIYIGQTINSICQRKAEHFYKVSIGSKSKFHNALRKRPDSFIWETILVCENKELDYYEIELINKFNSFLNGYNSTLGGDFNPVKIHGSYFKGRHHTEEAKRKLSESHKGKVASKELKEKLSLINRGSGNGMFGKKHSEETKQKMREARLNRKFK